MKIHPWWYMAYIAFILHVNGVTMITYLHAFSILHIKDSVCVELLGVPCTLLKNIGSARAPLAPPFLHLCFTWEMCALAVPLKLVQLGYK